MRTQERIVILIFPILALIYYLIIFPSVFLLLFIFLPSFAKDFLSPILYFCSLCVALIALYLTQLKGPEIRLLEIPKAQFSRINPPTNKIHSLPESRSEDITFIFQNTGSRDGAILNLELILEVLPIWSDYAENGEPAKLLRKPTISFLAPRMEPQERITDPGGWSYLFSPNFPIIVPTGSFVFFRTDFNIKPVSALSLKETRDTLDEGISYFLEAEREMLRQWHNSVKSRSSVANISLNYEVTSKRGKKIITTSFGELKIAPNAGDSIEETLENWEQLEPEREVLINHFLSQLVKVHKIILLFNRRLGSEIEQGSDFKSLQIKFDSPPSYFDNILQIWKPMIHEEVQRIFSGIRGYNQALSNLIKVKRNIETLISDANSQRTLLKKLAKELSPKLKEIIEEGKMVPDIL